MKRFPSWTRFPAALFPVLLQASAVWAAGNAEHGGHGDGHAEHGTPWGLLLLATINFVLFYSVLRRFVWPPVRAWIRQRHVDVVAEIEAAATARAEAEKIRREWQSRMAGLDTELASLRSQAEQDLARERERILAAAQKTAESILRDAERAVAAEVRQAQEQFRRELVEASVRQATEAVRKGWTPADQKQSITEFLQQVAR